MDQIANLVIDLSIDSAEFRNEVPRIKKLLNDAAGDSERSAARMQRFLDKQTEATRRTSASLDQVTASSTAYSSAVEKSAAASTRLAADVDQTRQRVEALGRKLREEQAQSAAVAAAQDRTSAAFYRQIDSVKQLSGGLQELQRIQAQVRQAKGRGDISQGDYLALVSETARKTRELTDAEALATQKKAQFIRRLKEQTTVQGLSRTELLRVKAAELGVSSAADIYIRKLERNGSPFSFGSLQKKKRSPPIAVKSNSHKSTFADCSALVVSLRVSCGISCIYERSFIIYLAKIFLLLLMVFTIQPKNEVTNEIHNIVAGSWCAHQLFSNGREYPDCKDERCPVQRNRRKHR